MKPKASFWSRLRPSVSGRSPSTSRSAGLPQLLLPAALLGLGIAWSAVALKADLQLAWALKEQRTLPQTIAALEDSVATYPARYNRALLIGMKALEQELRRGNIR